MKIRLEVAPERPPACRQQPSRRSAARCEAPAGHNGFHAGRTRRGYWKFWDTSWQPPAAPSPASNSTHQSAT